MTIWFDAIRPKTLWAGAIPVVIGSVVAFGDGGFHLWAFLAALICSLLIQIGTNLSNDYHDFVKGADTEDRKGPVRVTQAGLIEPSTVRLAAGLVFGAAFALGLYLVMRGGMPILAIGIISIICGILYTAGPYPLAYVGMGDLFVLVFFGPVAVAGTYYVQALSHSNWAVLAGLSPGLISVAILAVNNLRDVNEDRVANKKTLAVRFGERFARLEWAVCLIVAAIIPVWMAIAQDARYGLLACLLIVPLSIPLWKVVFQPDGGKALNPVLGQTARLLLIYAVLFSIGWLWR